MGQISTGDIRGGNKVLVEGQPFTVVSNEFVKPGKGQAFNRIRVRHLITGRVVEKTFKSGEKLEEADIIETSMRMLYKETDGAVFMNDDSFEQVSISFDKMGTNSQWLLEDQLYGVIFYNGEPVTIEPPTFIEMTITETEPGARGDTASGRVLKPAVTESGAKIQVPIFIDQDEKVKIDTRNGDYVSRVKD